MAIEISIPTNVRKGLITTTAVVLEGAVSATSWLNHSLNNLRHDVNITRKSLNKKPMATYSSNEGDK